MADVQVTVKHDDGSVRVIPAELLDRYTDRGWTKQTAKKSSTTDKS